MESRRAGNGRAALRLGAWAGLLTLAFQAGCSSTQRNQVLCTLSKDSIPAFDFRELAESARLARDAYRDSASNFAAYGGKYRVELFPLPKSAGQVLFLKDTAARRQLVSIRGTEVKLIKSVLTDAQYTKQFDSKLGIYVHSGFQKAVRELYDSLAPKLDTAYSTRITGHSLGGALAVLLTYYLTVDGYRLERTVTFGQPKVTNRAGVEKFKNVSLLRVINDKDPVAYVPPLSYVTAIESPYQHAGGALVLQEAPPYEYVCSEASNITFASEFWRDIVGKDQDASATLVGNLVFHRDRNYVEKLESLGPGPVP
jgi:triacylglycerol lipase